MPTIVNKTNGFEQTITDEQFKALNPKYARKFLVSKAAPMPDELKQVSAPAKKAAVKNADSSTDQKDAAQG